MTEAEQILWQHLRNRRLDKCKLRRRHPIGPFIADFFCSEKALVVEVDGEVHNEVEQKRKDRLRDLAIEKHGLMVLRFRNEEVRYHLDEVLECIRQALDVKL